MLILWIEHALWSGWDCLALVVGKLGSYTSMLEGTGVAPEGTGCPSLGRPGSAEGSDDRGLKVRNVQPSPASSCRC